MAKDIGKAPEPSEPEEDNEVVSREAEAVAEVEADQKKTR